MNLATIDSQVNNNGYLYAPDTFVRALSQASGDRIQVDVETRTAEGPRRAKVSWSRRSPRVTLMAGGFPSGLSRPRESPGWRPSRHR
jgi:hypothetical protein